MNKKSKGIISGIANLERELIRVGEIRQVYRYIERGFRALTDVFVKISRRSLIVHERFLDNLLLEITGCVYFERS